MRQKFGMPSSDVERQYFSLAIPKTTTNIRVSVQERMGTSPFYLDRIAMEIETALVQVNQIKEPLTMLRFEIDSKVNLIGGCVFYYLKYPNEPSQIYIKAKNDDNIQIMDEVYEAFKTNEISQP